jgi:hypothetical protein
MERHEMNGMMEWLDEAKKVAPRAKDIQSYTRATSDLMHNAYNFWTRVANAKTPLEFADAVSEMDSVMYQLATWVPGFNYVTREIEDDE